MLRPLFASIPFMIASAALVPGCVLCTNDACTETNETSTEDIGQKQDPVQKSSYKKFYISNPSSSANNYTRKANALKVTATIPTGGKITGIQIFDMYSMYAMLNVSCSNTTSCMGTKSLPNGCRNYGTIPVLVYYTYDSLSPRTPSLSYWFTDCK